MGPNRMSDDYQSSRQRVRAVESGWKAQHGPRVYWDPDLAPEYKRRFYGALYGHRGPAFRLLAHLEELAEA